jgi:peptide/nickel transport system permease protein
MTQYIVKRALFSLLVLWIISIIVFSAVRMIPGDVCAIVVNSPGDVDPAQCKGIREELGLDRPLVTQYLSYMAGALHGDLGTTLISKQDVTGQITSRLPLTMELTLLATLLSLLISLPIGVICATNQDRFADYSLRIITIGWLSIPSFFIGSILIIFPAKWWGYSPPVGYVEFWEDPLKNLEQLYLPAIALGLGLSASLARITRSAMLEVLRQDYVRTARAKGLAERAVIIRHTLKNAMIPVVTLFAIQFGVLLGGTVVLESIYTLPGLGTLTLTAVRIKDYPQVQGLVLVFATILIFINLLVDISYAWFDPRIRYS